MYIPSSIFTLKDVPGYSELFCLETNPHMYCNSDGNVPENNCARQFGGTVDVWNCDLVETYDDNVPQRYLIASWHMDESGVIVSELSGMCLTWNEGDVRTFQKDCDETFALIYDNGLMKVKYNTDLCIVPNLNDANYAGSSGLGLKVDDCNNMQGYWGYDQNPVVVYPTPTEEYWHTPDFWKDEKSNLYQTFITIDEGNFKNRAFESAMYKSEVIYHDDTGLTPGSDDYNYMMSFVDEWQDHSNSYTTFSYDGTTDITITVKKLLGSIPYNDVVIRPSGIATDIVKDSDSVSFKLSPSWGGAKKLSVEFDDDYKYNTCLLFVDELEDMNYNFHPSMFDPYVHYFGVGYHNVNQEVKEGEQVYVAGGAFVMSNPGSDKQSIIYTAEDGDIHTYVNDIHIGGRGIVSGKNSPLYQWLVQLCGLNVYVTGITMANALLQSNLGVNEPWHCASGWSYPMGLTESTGAQIYNVKIMGWYASDGINAGPYGQVSFSFVRVNDDGVKPFYTGSDFNNLVISQMRNGWAIMLAWLTEEDQDNIYVHDISIIHDDHYDCGSGCDFPVTPPKSGSDPYDINSQATIGADQGGSGMITNVRVEDINVETPVWRPFFLGVQKNFWGTSGTGYLKTWAFKNIYFSGFGTPSIILGGPNNPDQVDDIKFINLVQDGSPLTSWDPKYFEYTQDFGRPVGDIYFCANEPCPSFGDFSRSTKQHKSKKGKGAKKDK